MAASELTASITLDSIRIMSDGSIEVIEAAPPSPGLRQVPAPQFGTFGGRGHELVRIIHDNLNPQWGFRSRTLQPEETHRSTNEMLVPHRWYLRSDGEWRVDQYSKIQFWPEDNLDWLLYFKSNMTPWQWDWFCTPGKGWRDSGGGGSNYPADLNIYSFVVPGGNLLRTAGTWKNWTLFGAQDTNEAPKWYTYDERPDMVYKQGLVANWGNKENTPDSWQVDKNVGDLCVPNACPRGIAAILTSETRPVQDVPWSTTSNGVPVTFDELCFQGSNTLGRSDGNWYVVEEMEITGDGAWTDLRRYTDTPVCPVWPIPVKGSRRKS